ncbi:S-layer homology domain-containing protein [Paenibacillus oryzisoli]|uniref:NHL domain-containing protein n=1 Tax=Paenibacillus oryzisoli TaxID=1850517 RepID=UPI003D2E5EFF
MTVLLLIVPVFTPEIGRAATVTYGTTKLAGTGTAGYGGDGGAATAAKLNGPSGIWRDMDSGVMYIADTQNHRIRKIAANGNISTIAGTGTSGFSGDGGDATSAKLNQPTDVIMDGDGNLYIADSYNQRIRKVSADGKISTVAGTGHAGYNSDGIAATAAELNHPYGVALDKDGNLLIADTSNSRVRQVINNTGIISTIVGTGVDGNSGDGGAATAAQISQPLQLAVDVDGTLYLVDGSNQNARKVDSDGKISTLKGKNPIFPNMQAQNLQLSYPQGIAVDGKGNVYVPDSLNLAVRKLASDGFVYDIQTDNKYVHGLKVDGNGTIYSADMNNNGIYQMTILSQDAGLTSVAGQTDMAPAGGSGGNAGNAVTWSVSVPNSISTIGVADVVPATAAKAKLYRDNVFSSEVTGSGTISLNEGGATAFYVKVTAEDAITVKYYEVTINRASAISNDAGLTSVANKTDSAPGGGTGMTAESAIAWTLHVPDSQSTVGLADVVPAANATFKLYTDESLTNEVTGMDVIPLASGETTTMYIVVTAQDTTTVKYYAVAVHRAAPPSTNAGMISLAGKTDTAPGGDSGGTTNSTVAWSVYVPYGKLAIGRADIVVETGATFQLYSDSSFTEEVSGGAVIPLTEAGETVVYVKVTAEDAVTVKYYAATITRAAAPSSDAGLTSVAGKTDTAAAGGNGGTPADSVTWSVYVANDKSSLNQADIVPAAGATFKLSTDDSFSSEVTGTETIPLTAGGTKVIYLAVTAENETAVKYYKVSVTRAPDSDSNPNTGAGGPPPAEPQGVEVYVNGKAEKIGTLTTTKVNDRTVATLALDQQKISDKLAAEGSNALVTLVLNKESDVAIAKLTSENIGKLREYGATLEMKTAKSTYKLPSSELDLTKLAAEFGIGSDLQHAEVQIEIADSGADKVKLAEDAARAGDFTLVVQPVGFTVKVTHLGKSYEISRYSTYVERTIALPDDIDASKITTGLVIEPDGTIRHVPTKIEKIDGIYYAKINSLTNSSYSVVWHPLTFADMAQHWAKDAVNDMGSRFVIQGVDDKTFLPNSDITRVEFAAIILRGLGLKLDDSGTTFSDVPAGAWYESAIRTANAYGLIEGFEDGTFRPNDKITREQAMAIIAKAMKISGLKDKLPKQDASALLSQFADADTVAAWAKESVSDTLLAGIVTGRDGRILAPQAFVTRAEVALMVKSLLAKSELI